MPVKLSSAGFSKYPHGERQAYSICIRNVTKRFSLERGIASNSIHPSSEVLCRDCSIEHIAPLVVVTTLHQRRALLGDRRLESLKPASDIPNKSCAMLCIVHDLDKHKRDTANSAYTVKCYHTMVLQKNVDSSELCFLERASSCSFSESAMRVCLNKERRFDEATQQKKLACYLLS